MMGVFLALDLFLFYVFFEVMLLPMYFLIGIWGGENREYAAIKFLLYTLFGSVFILVAILIALLLAGTAGREPATGHSFDIVKLAETADGTRLHGRQIQRWVFVLFLIGFLIKLPSFPFHTWLPDAHVAGADADQHDPGRRPAEDRRLRPDPAGLAAGPPRGLRPVAGTSPSSGSSASSTAPWWRWPRPTSRSWSPTARSATWATSRWAWP